MNLSQLQRIMLPAFSVMAISMMAEHLPNLMDLFLDSPVPNKKSLTKSQKSQLNRFIRHKKKDGRGYDSSCREWNRTRRNQ